MINISNAETEISETINRLNSISKDMHIVSCENSKFGRYCIVHKGIDVSEYNELCTGLSVESGVTDIPSIPHLDQVPAIQLIKNKIFGEMPIQAGRCRGFNTTVYALEYHKSSEIIISVTGIILVLGQADDIVNDTYDLSNMESFSVPGHCIVELHPMVLHSFREE